eukprot:670213-Prorocentrum_minimum.AAC.2
MADCTCEVVSSIEMLSQSVQKQVSKNKCHAQLGTRVNVRAGWAGVGYTVCRVITAYRQQRCSRFPEARLRVFQAGSGIRDLSILGPLATKACLQGRGTRVNVRDGWAGVFTG